MTSDPQDLEDGDREEDWLIHIPATISIRLSSDEFRTEEDVTAEVVEAEVGKWVELRNGQDFDSDEFEIIDGPNTVALPAGIRPTGAALAQPLSPAEIAYRVDASGAISGIVAVEVGQLLDLSAGDLPDHLRQRLVGTEVLEQIGYEVVGHMGNAIWLNVTGQVSVGTTA